MKEFTIKDDLTLKRSWNGSEMDWHLIRLRNQKIVGFIELSDEEAEIVVAKIRQTTPDNCPDFDGSEFLMCAEVSAEMHILWFQRWSAVVYDGQILLYIVS